MKSNKFFFKRRSGLIKKDNIPFFKFSTSIKNNYHSISPSIVSSTKSIWNQNKNVEYKGFNLKIKNYCTTTNISENKTPVTEEKRIEIEQELNKAIEKHNGKYLLESLDIYRNVLNMIGEPNEETIEPYSFALLNIGQILIMYGYMDRDQKKVEEALDICKKLLMISPFEPQAHWNSFRCYAYLKDIEKAFAHLTIYEQQAPENLVKEVLQDIVPFVYTLGISLYRDKGSKGNKAADDCMRKVLEIDPNHVDSLYSLGYAYLESCSKQKGLEALEKCLSINNDYWQAHIRLGDMYKQSGDVENSKKHYENIERLKPEEPYYSAALYELGLIQMQKGEMKKSEKYFKKSLEANPDQPFTQANLANVLSNLGKYEDAMKHLIECSEKLNKPALYIAIATLAAKIEKFDVAKDYLERGAIKNQNYGGMEEFLRILAGTEIVHSGENYQDALTCFEMGDNIAQLLHEIQPSIKTIFYFNYAKLLERLEKFEEAKENYMRVTEIKDVPESDPLPLLARYAVGQMYINKGDNVEEGLDFLKEALQIYESKGGEASEMKPVEIRSSLNVPGSQNVAGLLYEKIGVAHSLRGEQELSVQNLEKSLEYNKNNPVVVANLANVYLTQNKVDKAISMLQECLQDHSHFAPLHSTLCIAFSKLNNWERSAHHGEMALGLDLTFQPEMVCQVLAVAFKELGDEKKSKEYEDKALTFAQNK